MYENSTEINILVNGKRCKIYDHEGRKYLEGKVGSEYSIEIKNNLGRRISAVATVDGLSVLTGKPGSVNDVGYIISNYSSYTIKGFRHSDDGVGAFKFSKKDKSYAKSKNDGSEINCGVIACKIYSEKIKQQKPVFNRYELSSSYAKTGSYGGRYIDNTKSTYTTYDSSFICENNTPILCNYSQQNSQTFNLGTEWGNSIKDSITYTSFDKGECIHDVVIYYMERDGLIELGVPLKKICQVNFPEGFPGDFAEPPPGWRG